MSKKKRFGPSPSGQLFKNLFEDRHPDESITLLLEGISASWRNAERLLSDTNYLVDDGRFSSARFLLAISREEIAKAYIIVDMCRLDFSKHEPVLKKLCQAFYNHVAKHAYLEVVKFPNIRSLSDAEYIWDIEVKRWWPATPGDGEPDMPHDIYFNRELPLYVNYEDYDQSWHVPDDTSENAYFEELFGQSRISETARLVSDWRDGEKYGLISVQVLNKLHAIFKGEYCGEDKKHRDISRSYERLASLVEKDLCIESDKFLKSPLVEWPLYDCVSKGY